MTELELLVVIVHGYVVVGHVDSNQVLVFLCLEDFFDLHGADHSLDRQHSAIECVRFRVLVVVVVQLRFELLKDDSGLPLIL